MDANKVSSISKADTIEAIGDFWDTHDFTDFDGDGPDVEFRVSSKVAIDAELLSSVEQVARRHGVRVETLVNLWLSEKVLEQTGINP
jgi:hypothetical protein